MWALPIRNQPKAIHRRPNGDRGSCTCSVKSNRLRGVPEDYLGPLEVTVSTLAEFQLRISRIRALTDRYAVNQLVDPGCDPAHPISAEIVFRGAGPKSGVG